MARRTVNVPINGSVTFGAENVEGGSDLLGNLLSDAGIETRPGMTIVRIRGYMYLVGPVGSQVNIACALMVVPEGGISAPPNLFGEIVNAIWRFDGLTTGQAREVAASTFEPIFDVYPIETRGMRKFSRVGDELRIYASGNATGNTLFIAATVRVMLES